MHLLNVRTRKLERFEGTRIPFYAILSHTWEDDEITFQDIDDSGVEERAGYEKVRKTCEIAAADGFDYVWIDTCCIDKRSSAELSEAINSMYRWYQEAGVCYVYLRDFGLNTCDPENDGMSVVVLRRCRWFGRGWTLQELIAPPIVIFLNCTWDEIGTKSTLGRILSDMTRIPEEILQGEDLGRASVAQRMSWASHRQTTRLEDRAYSLMGLFGVNMPLLYGEGKEAFTRLQEEIIKRTRDCTILAWGSSSHRDRTADALASSPKSFWDSTRIILDHPVNSSPDVIVVDNKGVHLQAWVLEGSPDFDKVVVLPCIDGSTGQRVAFSGRSLSIREDYFARLDHHDVRLLPRDIKLPSRKTVCIQQRYRTGIKCSSNMSRAARHGNTNVVQRFLQQGADPNVGLFQGYLPLENAVRSGHAALVKLLLEKGAHLEYSHASKETPLHCAVRGGYETVASILIENGADLEARNGDWITPLVLAVRAENVKMAELLVEKGADLEATDDQRKTALIEATGQGCEQVVRLLIEKGACLEARNRYGETPLAIAARKGQDHMVRFLLERGAYLETRDHNNNTPLISAVLEGHKTLVKALVEHGADCSARNTRGNSALDLARARPNNAAIVRLLESYLTDSRMRSRRDDGIWLKTPPRTSQTGTHRGRDI